MGEALETTEAGAAVASQVVTPATAAPEIATKLGASDVGRGGAGWRRAASCAVSARRGGGAAASELRSTCERASTACCTPVGCAGERAAAGPERRAAPVVGATASGEAVSTRAA